MGAGMVAARPLASPPFSPRALRCIDDPFAAPRHRSGDLLPSRLWIELLCIAAGQDLERGVGVAFEVDVALRMLVPEPVRRYEVRHEDATNLVAVLVILDRVADLTGPKDSLRILVGAVQPRIHCHLANFVSSADTNARVVGFDGFHENFGDR